MFDLAYDPIFEYEGKTYAEMDTPSKVAMLSLSYREVVFVG
jgi:inosine/xanthosine triphosphate pyrophosphatase family protein